MTDILYCMTNLVTWEQSPSLHVICSVYWQYHSFILFLKSLGAGNMASQDDLELRVACKT